MRGAAETHPLRADLLCGLFWRNGGEGLHITALHFGVRQLPATQ